MLFELYGGDMDIIKTASENVFKQLIWHVGKRDQAGVAEELANEQNVDEIYGLGEADYSMNFFCFLRKLGIMKILEQLSPRRNLKRHSPVLFPAVMLIYLMRMVTGLKFFYHVGPVLLQSQSLMRLVGFNGHQVKQGVNRRSLDNLQRLGGQKQHCDKRADLSGIYSIVYGRHCRQDPGAGFQ